MGTKVANYGFCASIGAEELHACRDAHDIGSEVFEIKSCTCGQVIHVRSAVIGHSPQWDPDADTPICPMNEANCTTETSHSDIMSCNQATSCRISQQVLKYALPAELCDGQKHGNFIRIVYDCVKVRPANPVHATVTSFRFRYPRHGNIKPSVFCHL